MKLRLALTFAFAIASLAAAAHASPAPTYEVTARKAFDPLFSLRNFPSPGGHSTIYSLYRLQDGRRTKVGDSPPLFALHKAVPAGEGALFLGQDHDRIVLVDQTGKVWDRFDEGRAVEAAACGERLLCVLARTRTHLEARAYDFAGRARGARSIALQDEGQLLSAAPAQPTAAVFVLDRMVRLGEPGAPGSRTVRPVTHTRTQVELTPSAAGLEVTLTPTGEAMVDVNRP